MIRNLDIPLVDGGAWVRQGEAPGVVAALADRLRRSPWLTFEGAVASWDGEFGEREIEITRELWSYIRMRAAGEAPDPGSVENVAEYLWSDGVTGVELGVEARSGYPVGVLRVRVGNMGAGYSEPRPSSTRDAYLVAHMYTRIIREVTQAFPPDFEVRSDPSSMAPPARASVTAICLGCNEHQTFGCGVLASGRPEAPSEHWIRYEMMRRHRLCGVRHADKIAEEKRRREYQKDSAFGFGARQMGERGARLSYP